MTNTPRAAGEQREQFEQAIYELQWAARELGFQVGSGIDATGKQRHVAEVEAARQALLDQWREQQAEMERLIRGHNEYNRVNLLLTNENDRLTAENAALRQDRERLDWLETECVAVSVRQSASRPRGDVISADRAAIDAARQAGRTEGENR